MAGIKRYVGAVAPQQTSQMEPIFGREAEMVQNNEGGYVFGIDQWAQLRRFLIIGTDGGTYYARGEDGQKKLTQENARIVLSCLKDDGARTVREIRQVSVAGKAPKNDAAIFALALAAKKGDDDTRRAAFSAMPDVCRTGTHLFAFASAIDALGGWGRGTRTAIGKWYSDRSLQSLAYQLTKYQQREGWSHRDLLRLAHPKPSTVSHRALYGYAVGGFEKYAEVLKDWPDGAVSYVDGVQSISQATDGKTAARLIREHRLPREVVPTDLLGNLDVWEALLDDMPMTAMIRNLATMTRIGLLRPLSEATKHILTQLGDAERIHKARVHPMAILLAMKTYESGHGVRSGQTWTPLPEIVDALSSAFYAAYSNVVPVGGGTLLALDISASMGVRVGGFTNLSCSEAEAAMALITANTEAAGDCHIMGFSDTFRPLAISPKQRLTDATRAVSNQTFGGTNCALPMLYAAREKLPVKLFVVYTDNETHHGSVHPIEALRQYRQEMGIAAKLVVCAFTSTGFSIADPTDGGSLDVVGLDATVPDVISEFARS